MGFRRKLALGWTSQGGKSRWAGSASVLPSRRLEADSGLATWRPSKLVQPLAETLAKTLALHPENLIAVGWLGIARFAWAYQASKTCRSAQITCR